MRGISDRVFQLSDRSQSVVLSNVFSATWPARYQYIFGSTGLLVTTCNIMHQLKEIMP